MQHLAQGASTPPAEEARGAHTANVACQIRTHARALRRSRAAMLRVEYRLMGLAARGEVPRLRAGGAGRQTPAG